MTTVDSVAAANVTSPLREMVKVERLNLLKDSKLGAFGSERLAIR